MIPDVVIVGGGAAGILAAFRAAELGSKVLLLEKTDRIGTKILISGGGKCNITHDGPLEDVLRAFRPEEARFIRPACYRFPPSRILELLHDRGIRTMVRSDGRVFPVGQTAKDVVRALVGMLSEVGVEMRIRCAVSGLETSEGAISAVQLRDGGSIHCDRVVVTTGGCTYPNCGTSGDGWPWLAQVGHTITPIRAALAPMDMTLPWESPSGLALRGVTLKARQCGKEIARWNGDLLFTHRGVSGPCALGISRVVAERMEAGSVELEVDFASESNHEEVQKRVLQRTHEQPHRTVMSWLQEYAPERAACLLMQDADIPIALLGGKLDKKSRNRLIEALKGWKLGVVSAVPIEKGEVAAGGVALDEVDSKTLRSLKCKGLFLAGEILDIAGPVGGYNLQAAWATGYVAGESAAMG